MGKNSSIGVVGSMDENTMLVRDETPPSLGLNISRTFSNLKRAPKEVIERMKKVGGSSVEGNRQIIGG